MCRSESDCSESCVSLCVTCEVGCLAPYIYGYIQCTYGIFSKEITIQTVVYVALIIYIHSSGWPLRARQGLSACNPFATRYSYSTHCTLLLVLNAL